MFRKEPEIYLVRFAVSGDLWFLLGKLAPRWVDVCRGKHVFFRVHSRHSRLKKAAGCELQVEECASLPAFTKLQRATFNAQHLFPSASLCGLCALAVQILPHAVGDKWARPAATPYRAHTLRAFCTSPARSLTASGTWTRRWFTTYAGSGMFLSIRRTMARPSVIWATAV